jgi:hypothetical protein
MREDSYWSNEPPWLSDLPVSYAAYFRQLNPENGLPRWRAEGIPQLAVIAALLRVLESAPDRSGHVRRVA